MKRRMDYLEGFLIGSVWSDTDYTSRRHFNAHIFLATVMAAVFLVLTFFPERRGQLIVIHWPTAPVLLIFLVILTPILSIFYRRLPFFVKPLVLLFYAFKYLLLFYVLVHYFLPMVTFEKESILDLILARVDSHIETSLEIIAESGGILATVGGVVAGGLWVIGELLGLIGLLVLVPLLAIILFKGLQYGLDYLVKFLLDRQLADISPLAVADIPWQGEMDEAGANEPGPAIPVPAEDRSASVLMKKRLPARARPGPRPVRHKAVIKRQAAVMLATLGGALAAFGAWFSAFAKKTGAKVKQTGNTLQARVKTRRKKQTVRKSRIKLQDLDLKGEEEEAPSGEDFQGDT